MSTEERQKIADHLDLKLEDITDDHVADYRKAHTPRFPDFSKDDALALVKRIRKTTSTMFSQDAKDNLAADMIKMEFLNASNRQRLCLGCGGQLDCDECHQFRIDNQ